MFPKYQPTNFTTRNGRTIRVKDANRQLSDHLSTAIVTVIAGLMFIGLMLWTLYIVAGGYNG